MHTDAIVTDDDIQRARLRVRHEGLRTIMRTFSQTEPALHRFIQCAAYSMAGRLALFEHDPPMEDKDFIVRETADELLDAVLVSLLALRAAQKRLWKLEHEPGPCEACGGDGPPTTDQPLDYDDLPF
jgi:hypothetical protein